MWVRKTKNVEPFTLKISLDFVLRRPNHANVELICGWQLFCLLEKNMLDCLEDDEEHHTALKKGFCKKVKI